jgi:glycosyltransferase involved in cell wall biosynthesis
LQNTFTDWELHVVGPDRETYAEQMKQLAIDLKLERICFPGPAYGDDKMLHYQNADLFVLPTQTENFGIAIAEALANGLPVVTTKGAPWQGLDTHNCGWWIDHGEPALVESLCHAMSLPPHELNLAGQRGRDWVQREFSWQRVGKMTYQLYEWLLGTGAAPSFVELN